MARGLVIAYTTYIHDGRVKRQAEAMAERGDEIDAITLAAGQTGLINGVNVVGLEIPRYRGSSRASYVRSYLKFFMLAARKARELTALQRYDYAIVCTMPDAAILSAIALRRQGTKLVLDVHDTMPELYRDKFPGPLGAIGARILTAEERVSASWADLLLAVHQPHRERLIRSGIPAGKVKVVMNSPDRYFVPQDSCERNAHSPHNPNYFTLVCHGTITHRMGLDLGVRALALLRDRISQARLVVIGAGDYLHEIRRLVTHLKLDERVIFKGMMPVQELPQMLRIADVGLVPNRASSATHLMLPVKLLEFAVMGIPVVCARLKTIEYYFDDQSVRFFHPGDVENLAATIEEVYRSPELATKLAANARKVMEAISWPNQREELYRAIDSLLPPRGVTMASKRQIHMDKVVDAGMER